MPAEQTRVDSFLASDGGDAARRVLLAGAPWRSPSQFGVTSKAMFGLLDGLRRLRTDGGDIEVVPFNRPSATPGGGTRDKRMAEALAAAAFGNVEGVVVALTGSFHSRAVPGMRGNPQFQPLGLLLGELLDPPRAEPESEETEPGEPGPFSAGRVVTLDVEHAAGTAWICLAGSGCGPRQVSGRGPSGRGITLNESSEVNGHHGWYHVGSITASPPPVFVPVQETVGSKSAPP